MKHRKIIAATREVVCPECGGSGMRWGCDRDIECFDCGGEGSWEEEAVCLCCEGPLVDGECAACTEPLCEVRGDPFKARKAA